MDIWTLCLTKADHALGTYSLNPNQAGPDYPQAFIRIVLRLGYRGRRAALAARPGTLVGTGALAKVISSRAALMNAGGVY